MSDLYEFAMSRKRAMALAGCFLTAAALLFVAGILAGMLLSGNRQGASRAGGESPFAKSSPKVPNAPVAPPATETASGGGTLQPASAASSDLHPTDQPGPSASQSSQGQAGAPAKTPILEGGSTRETKTADTASSSTAKETDKSTAAVPSRPVEVSYAIPLAVKVASFTVKSNAESLVVSLSDLGYRPVLRHSTDSHGRLWYSVELGPYTSWSTASAVAAQVSIERNVRPIISPVQ